MCGRHGRKTTARAGDGHSAERRSGDAVVCRVGSAHHDVLEHVPRGFGGFERKDLPQVQPVESPHYSFAEMRFMKMMLTSVVVGIGLLAGLTLLAAEPAKPNADKAVAGSIDGYVFKFPCKGEMPEKPVKGADAESALVPDGAD